jgi:simple sugar transport system ATP-binding protein
VDDRPPVAIGPRRSWLDREAIRERARKIVRLFDVRPGDLDLPARALSGGNQQKLVLGRELELPPRLLLVAQPTRGVDIGGIEFIHRRLVELRDSGCAILLVSSELEEVTALSDRLLVMRRGRIVAEVDPARASTEEIGLLMTGGEAAA